MQRKNKRVKKMNNNQARQTIAINEENAYSFLLNVKKANFPQIAAHFDAQNTKRRLKVQEVLYGLAEKEKIFYSTQSRLYYITAYYKKVKGIKKCKLKTIYL